MRTVDKTSLEIHECTPVHMGEDNISCFCPFSIPIFLSKIFIAVAI